MQPRSQQIRLIDFEYAGWNPRAADIANTFCEHCDMNNIRADYEKEYPSVEAQNEYFRSYLEESADPSSPIIEFDRDEPEAEAAFYATLRAEVGRFTLLSHLMWAIWSLIMSKKQSNIDFDYVEYAHHRMDGYDLFKKKFFDG